MFDLEIYNVKLQYTDINFNFVKVFCGNSTPPIKMEIRFLYTQRKVCNDSKNHELQNKIVANYNLPQWDVEKISTYFSV